MQGSFAELGEKSFISICSKDLADLLEPSYYENQFDEEKAEKISFMDPKIILFWVLLTVQGMWYSMAAPFLPSEAASIGIR
jgi:hypothetical protein